MVVTQTNNEDNPLMHGVVEHEFIPLLGIDLWEHAYLRQHQGDKLAYLDAFWTCLDWSKVSANFESFALQGKAVPINSN